MCVTLRFYFRIVKFDTMDDDIIRIIISTDNHLGFAYKDPIRCDDCFASFEEVFIAAKEVKKRNASFNSSIGLEISRFCAIGWGFIP
jgi:hypothetical protein